jgi:hypothetical protein
LKPENVLLNAHNCVVVIDLEPPGFDQNWFEWTQICWKYILFLHTSLLIVMHDSDPTFVFLHFLFVLQLLISCLRGSDRIQRNAHSGWSTKRRRSHDSDRSLGAWRNGIHFAHWFHAFLEP